MPKAGSRVKSWSHRRIKQEEPMQISAHAAAPSQWRQGDKVEPGYVWLNLDRAPEFEAVLFMDLAEAEEVWRKLGEAIERAKTLPVDERWRREKLSTPSSR